MVGRPNAHSERGRRVKAPPLILGWFEPVVLPKLGIERAYARIDTGADTSTLHGRDILVVSSGDDVEFTAPLLRVQHDNAGWPTGGVRRVRARLVDRRIVRSSNGEEETRFVVRTRLQLGGIERDLDFSVTNREGMRFPILLGRRALAELNAWVDPSRCAITARDASGSE